HPPAAEPVRLRGAGRQEPGAGPAPALRPGPDPGVAVAVAAPHRGPLMAAYGSLTATLNLRGAGDRADIVEIREPDRPPRRFTVDDLVEVGRRRRLPPGMVGLEHPGVSRRHTRFQVLGGQLTVVDLGSTNGTLVNGTRIGGTTRLSLGDTI